MVRNYGDLPEKLTLHALPFKFTQDHWNRDGLIGYLYFLLVFHSNCRPISCRFRDEERY